MKNVKETFRSIKGVSIHHDIHIGLRTSKNSSKINTLLIVKKHKLKPSDFRPLQIGMMLQSMGLSI